MKRIIKIILICAWISTSFCFLLGSPPQWWIDRGVIDTSLNPSNYDAVNLGQAKWVTKKAIEELDEELDSIDGATFTLDDLLDSQLSADDYAPLNLGQLKHLSHKFYDRLVEVGFTDDPVNSGHPKGYPWTESTGDDSNSSPANLGQLKYVFSWDLDTFTPPLPGVGTDWDHDGLDDGWELIIVGFDASIETIGEVFPEGDYDGDGYLESEEYGTGTSPIKRDHPAVNLVIFSNLK